MLDYYFWR